MAIVQISKIQQRAGNLVDLPQLDNGEFGWATDENRLFIGRTGNTYADENIEVLTSYSNISFSQINGSDGGNFNITVPLNGQILTYVSSTDTWENYTGLNSQLGGAKLKLGNVSNISMTGGAIGYILETDGLGNLSWTPKNTLYTTIKGLTNNITGNIVTMTVSNLTPYTNGQIVTITSATITNSGANSNINGHTFYLKLNGDYATSGNVVLYTDLGLTATANGAGLLTYVANSGIATAALGGSGSGVVGGSNTTVQFNDQNISNGVAAFTFDKNTTTLTVSSGNVVAGNINAVTAVTGPVIVSNVAVGTAPLTVTSTTLVPNLFVARSNVSEYANTALTTTGTWYPLFVNATSGNLAQGANANLSFNASTGNLTTTLLNVTGNANTGNLGTTTLVATTGNITTINSGLMKNSTSNITIASAGNVSTFIGGNATAQFVVTSTGANIPGTANVVTLVTSTATITTGNITTINSGLMQNGNSNITITANANISHFVTGNTTSQLTVTATGANIPGTANVGGNANVGNLGTAQVLASANITTPQFISNVATGTAPLSVQSTTVVPNLYVARSNVSEYGNVVSQTAGTFYPTMVSASASANYQLGSNVNLSFAVNTGTLSATLFTGTLTTAAQPNITSVGTLTSLTVSGNINSTGNINANYIVGNDAYQGGLNIVGKIGAAGDSEQGGSIGIQGGNGNSSGVTIGGVVTLSGGAASANGLGGYVGLVGGLGAGTGAFIQANGGSSNSSSSGGDLILRGGAGRGTNTNGGIITITGGIGTGTGTPGNVAIRVAAAIASGSANQTAANVVVFSSSGITFAANGNITQSGASSQISGANLVSASYLTGTLTTAAQPNITSTGTLTSLAVTGNITNGNVTGGNLVSASYLTGTLTTAAQPNITSTGTLTSLAVTGNITNGNVTGGNLVSASYLTGTLTTAAQPNITSVSTSFTNLTFANAQTISGNNMTLTTGANTLLGTITGNWSLSAGSKLQATYADLAEYYESDKSYEPGTVVEFGGEKEVTIAEDGTTRVAGVVSTNPAYVMNSQCQGEHVVAVALQGRVPCKVRGTIHKGDMLVSGGNGFARPSQLPVMGMVIGKSLENFEGEGVIEVAVGRL